MTTDQTRTLETWAKKDTNNFVGVYTILKY